MNNTEEKSIVEEIAEEPLTDTSTKRARFSTFTLIFIVMVLVGLVIAAASNPRASYK